MINDFQDIAEKTCLLLTLRTGYFDNCPWCQTATSSVMDVLSSDLLGGLETPKESCSSCRLKSMGKFGF